MKKSGKTFDWDSTNLQKLIDESGTTVAMVAKQCGFTFHQLQKYLREETCPSVIALCKLADVFAVPLDYLVGRCSEKEAETFFKTWKGSYGDLQRIRYEDLLLQRIEGFEIPQGYDLPWPYNLYEKIFSKPCDHVLSLDELDGIEYVLDDIPDNLEQILRMHYQDYIPCAGIGRKLKFHRETIRAKISDAIRLIRQPALIGYIQDGKMKHIELVEGNKQVKPTITSLSLSARAYNALVHAKILYIDDLVKSIEKGDLIKNRTIGTKIYNEIIDGVNQRYGYEFLKAEKKSYSPYSLTHTSSTYGNL